MEGETLAIFCSMNIADISFGTTTIKHCLGLFGSCSSSSSGQKVVWLNFHGDFNVDYLPRSVWPPDIDEDASHDIVKNKSTEDIAKCSIIDISIVFPHCYCWLVDGILWYGLCISAPKVEGGLWKLDRCFGVFPHRSHNVSDINWCFFPWPTCSCLLLSTPVMSSFSIDSNRRFNARRNR